MVIELDALPDWLTVTTDTHEHTAYLRAKAQMYIGCTSGARPWRFRDYVGRRRHDAHGEGGIAFGEKSGGSKGVMQTWGPLSLKVARNLGREDLKATRVDLAVTVLHDSPQMSVAELMPTLDPDIASYSGIVPLNNEGGTLYVGSRSSDIYGRLYDKGAQMQCDVPDRVLWRYEIECKRNHAQQAAHEVWSQTRTPEDMRLFVLTEVERFFLAHGVPVPFNIGSNSQHSVLRYATRVQDSKRTIRWLTEQVGPCLMRMIDNGYHDAVVDALGVGVRDGVPTFEMSESVHGDQYLMWPELDRSAKLV